MNIIVLCGGLSAERDVSLASGKMAAGALCRLGHKAVAVDMFFGYTGTYNSPEEIFSLPVPELTAAIGTDAPDLEALRASRGADIRGRIGKNIPEICAAADIVFLALHGSDGEDGKIQALFDLYEIKYTGTSPLGSAISLDKDIAKKLLAAGGINVPNGIVVSKSDSEHKNVGFPCVVKPKSGGSSVGTSVVEREEDYLPALELAFKYEDSVIVEQFIRGRECDVGVLNGKALPVVEICPKSGFFDYKNKYMDGMTDEYCPADLPESITAELQAAALKVFDILRLGVYARMDFIVDSTGKIWCLEANTLPGLTPSSLLPKEAAAAGIGYDELCGLIVEKSMEKYL